MLNCISYLYESGYYTMGKNKKSKKQNEKNVNCNVKQQEDECVNNNDTVAKPKTIEINLKINKKLLSLILTIVGGFLTFIGYQIWDFHGNFSALCTDVSNYGEEIKENSKVNKETNKQMNDIKTEIALLKETNESFESELNGFKNTINQPVVYLPSPSMQDSLSERNIDADASFLSSPNIKDNDIIGEDPNTGKKYKAKKLKNKNILLPYTENGKEVYFYGQYNKYYQWNGDCILNIYKNNKLYMIMEGRYKDGELLSYRQVNYYVKTQKMNETEKQVSVWSVSERESRNGINVGETYTYFKKSNKNKKFTTKNVKSKDILSVIDFEDWLNTPLEGYYKGNTSNGKYNDETGKSYLIKYFEDGTTRTIYCGNFKNGVFNDHTGKAWYVAIDEGAKKYIYFKGGFTNGKPDETDNHKREDIDNKDIHKIIDNMKFNSIINLRGDKYRST